MATTYTPISTVNLSSLDAVTFSSIPNTYTDLVIVINGAIVTGQQNLNLRFNGDTSSIYSRTFTGASGSGYDTSRENNYSYITLDRYGYFSSTPTNYVIDIMNYKNTNIFKSIISKSGNPSYGIGMVSGLWRSTSAITSITLYLSGSTWTAGSTASLYGIASPAVTNIAKATGGDTIATDGTYWYHAFRTSGTFTPASTLSCDVLVIGGGGGGGASRGAGGGAGGIFYATSQSISAAQTITVGAGGNGGGTGGNGSNGNNSIFGSLTAGVGGGGAGSNTAPKNGNSGGSGGGGGGDTGTGGASTQTGTGGTGYGNVGGNSATSGSGGGGGAGTAGVNGTTDNGGSGGNGLNTWSSWATVTGTGVNGYYAGGGTGYGGVVTGTGGLGGGGNRSTSGTTNTGSGGGAWDGSGTAGNGGSGIIIVRYPV